MKLGCRRTWANSGLGLLAVEPAPEPFRAARAVEGDAAGRRPAGDKGGREGPVEVKMELGLGEGVEPVGRWLLCVAGAGGGWLPRAQVHPNTGTFML